MAWCFAVRFSYSFAGTVGALVPGILRLVVWGVARLRHRVCSCGVALRASGYHPRGHASGDPLTKGRETRPFTYWPSARVGLRLGVSDSPSLARENGRPSGPAPCGPDPAAALACATGPEGGTRRLFPTVRWSGGRAPPTTCPSTANERPRCAPRRRTNALCTLGGKRTHPPVGARPARDMC